MQGTLLGHQLADGSFGVVDVNSHPSKKEQVHHSLAIIPSATGT
jgi:hypothetical protein